MLLFLAIVISFGLALAASSRRVAGAWMTVSASLLLAPVLVHLL